MNLIVLTPETEVYNGPIKAVKVPGISGQFEILKGHAAIVSALGKGSLRITEDNGDQSSYTIQGGFVEVLRNEVSVLVTSVEKE